MTDPYDDTTKKIFNDFVESDEYKYKLIHIIDQILILLKVVQLEGDQLKSQEEIQTCRFLIRIQEIILIRYLQIIRIIYI